MRAAVPERIGRYEIRGELGRGSMGTVYAAYDPNLDRQVALKVMSERLGDAGSESDLLDRFRLEARAAARLSHPGIVAIHDADVDAATGLSYIAMELVAGRSLDAILRQHGRLSRRRSVALGVQVARALDAAHRRGLVHRDVKPGNILIAEDGTAKLSDFGIAKLGLGAMTVPGQVLGSPFYMSPEQVQGSAADGRSDLFSLGAVLYQAITGVPPFTADSLAAIVFKVVNVEPRPLAERTADVPPALEEIVLRCLAKDPGERFGSAAELAGALERLAAELPGDDPGGAAGLAELVEIAALGAATLPVAAAESGATTVVGRGRPTSARRRPRWAVGAALFGGLLLVAAALGVRWGDQPPPRLEPAETGGVRPATLSPAAEAAADPTPEPPLLLPLQHPPEVQLPAELQLDLPAAPVAETTAAKTAPPERSATLELLFRSRLKAGLLAVWVDGELAWSGPVYGHRNLIRRPFGKETRQEIRLPPGRRTIEVRIEGRSMETVASRVVVGRFLPDQPRQLRASLNPYSDTLELAWLDGTPGTR